jgi:hypothetical protein
MANSNAIKAGRAFVELFADDSKLVSGQKKAKAKLFAFGAGLRESGLKLVGVGGDPDVHHPGRCHYRNRQRGKSDPTLAIFGKVRMKFDEIVTKVHGQSLPATGADMICAQCDTTTWTIVP